MNTYHILNNENGYASFRLKIFLLVISILVPFTLINTIVLKSLHYQIVATINNQQQLAMVGGGFFSIFIANIIMAVVVAGVATGIVLWILKPWDNLCRKVIHLFGGGSPPPPGTSKIDYAIDLLDKFDTTSPE